MSNPNLVPKPITDKNGKNTTVLVNPDKGVNDTTAARVSAASVAPPAAATSDDDTVVNKAIAEIKASKGYELVGVQYDDNFNDNKEVINAFLGGDQDAISDFLIGIDSSDELMDSVIAVANDVLSKHGMNWNDLDDDEQDEIREEIQDKDTSDIYGGLLRNTSDQLVTYNIENVIDALSKQLDFNNDDDADKRNFLTDGSQDNFDERVDFVEKYLDSLGFDLSGEDAQNNLRSLVANGNYDWHEGVQMGFTFSAGIQDLNIGEYDVETSTMKEEREITFTNTVNFGMIDRYNGSGWVEEFPVKANGVSFTADKGKPVELDSSTNGYGWGEIVGGVSGMGADVISRWK